MGLWRGKTFKEHIHAELDCFLAGMSKNMQRKFEFVNVCGGAYSDGVDVTTAVLTTPYNTQAVAAA